MWAISTMALKLTNKPKAARHTLKPANLDDQEYKYVWTEVCTPYWISGKISGMILNQTFYIKQTEKD